MEVTAVGTRETASGLASRVEFRPFATSSTETVPGPRGELMLLKDGRLYLGDQTNIGFFARSGGSSG